jgi:DNA-binding response OmpR family regulator
MSSDRVLCVEDDADTRDMLKLLLSYSDFAAAVAPDADAALRLMERERFSLYVLDGELRSVKGLSLCEEIRAADVRTPIVIFSGDSSPSNIRAGLLAGADAYVIKPNTNELVPAVRRLLGESRPRG